MGEVSLDRSGDETLPEWCARLPAQPTVYLSLGTVSNYHTDIFRMFLEALRDESVNLIVTVGRNQDPAQFGPQPAHIHIERYIPQTLLFAHCDVVITHGGSGTVMAALTHGLPMVEIPVGADQPVNARRCVALGVGRMVGAEERTPESIRQAVRDVLGNSDYRARAERLGEKMAALPGPEHAVALLERLAAEKRPIIAP